MGLLELFLAGLLAGIATVNTAIPVATFLRARDPRFLFVASASGLLAALGALWAWAEIPGGTPVLPSPSLALELLVLVSALLLLVGTLWPRRA